MYFLNVIYNPAPAA